MIKRYTFPLFFLALLINFTATAQSDFPIWNLLPKQQLGAKEVLAQKEMPNQFQAYRIADLEALERILQLAPLRFSEAAEQTAIEITLPLPDGRMDRFKLFRFPVMQSSLARTYPKLQTFTAAGISNPNAMAKIEMTPSGFSAMIWGYEHTIFIEPFRVSEQTYYSFYKKDAQHTTQTFSCEVEESIDNITTMPGLDPQARSSNCQLRQYRLALACTGEYAQFYDDGDDSNGDIIADALATMVVAINRINGIFERELGLTMVLIDDNAKLIFTDPETDPYTNSSTNDMLSENLATCNDIIGSQNYDIGHVFGFGGGGRAFIMSPCTFNRGRGVSRSNSGINDAFIDIVAHEMGHQFGARHTQNAAACLPSASSSYEPGSGSTIMSYAGVCSPAVQSFSDLYFHAISLEQMGAFITGTGGLCPVYLSADNNPPIADAGSNYTIPISTPFVLTGIGTDPDDDPMTYCWEQWDKEFAPMPPESTSEVGPNFRSLLPSPEPERYFPRLRVLVGLEDDTWEVLPSVSRELNFRLTVRDNHEAYGCTDASDMTVTTDDSAGPFVITSPNAFTTWEIGNSEMITWDVANTNVAPVNCANVDILYSTDGGLSYPNVLAESVPNNGAYSLIVPELSSTAIRFMVRCTDNIFFDVSDVDIAIGAQLICAAPNSDDTPILISSAGTPTIISELNVDLDETIKGIKVVNLKGTHENIWDLRFKLISPSGIERILVDRKCGAFSDFDIVFDDFGNELSCPYNDGEITRPVESLSIFNGTSSLGIWKLEIADLSPFDGGELLSWGLEFCYEESTITITNTNELSDQASMELSPNPVSSYLNVALSFNDAFDGHLQVMNTYGKVLAQVAVAGKGSTQHQLQLDYLPAGIYLLRLADHTGRQVVEKFIKQ
ncbi:MAG: reprolysin-like metallopeptidase [Bacteroidota bacterium]